MSCTVWSRAAASLPPFFCVSLGLAAAACFPRDSGVSAVLLVGLLICVSEGPEQGREVPRKCEGWVLLWLLLMG